MICNCHYRPSGSGSGVRGQGLGLSLLQTQRCRAPAMELMGLEGTATQADPEDRAQSGERCCQVFKPTRTRPAGFWTRAGLFVSASEPRHRGGPQVPSGRNWVPLTPEGGAVYTGLCM